MKKFLLPLAACFLMLASCNSGGDKDKQAYPNIQKIADDIQKKYVPDRRTDVFDIEVVDNNGVPVIKGATTVAAAQQELLELAKKENSKLVDSTELLPQASLEGKIYGVINLSVANVRTKASYAAEMATQALLGTPIKVLQKKSWYRIQTPDGYIGWAAGIAFQPMTKDEFNAWTVAKKIVFTNHYGFAYQNADESGATVSDVVSGNMLKYEGDAGKFYKVSFPDGRQAYLLKSQSKPMEDWLAGIQLTEKSIVDKAFTLLGVPYLWGGTSAKGVDCSGLTKTTMFLHGIIMLRDASQQVHTGTPVDISNGYDSLRVGDLMFFGKKADGDKKERIRHVGFYLGNNEFIHSAGRVKVNSLDSTKTNYDELNTKEFIKASRIIGAVDTKGMWSIQNHPMYQVQP